MVSLVMREKEIRTTQRYHYTTNRKAKIFNMTTPSVDEDAAAVGSSHTLLVGSSPGKLPGKLPGACLAKLRGACRVTQQVLCRNNHKNMHKRA